jgi:cytochrome c
MPRYCWEVIRGESETHWSESRQTVGDESMRAKLWAIAAAATLLPMMGCNGDESLRLGYPLGGDPDVGQQLLYSYACHSCHVIPGVRGRPGTVGPPLDRFGVRSYIAGVLPNTSENLIRWVMDPQAISPGTAMPGMGVTEIQARHIAAYLSRLR